LTHCAAIVSTVALSNGSPFGAFAAGRWLDFFKVCGGFVSAPVVFLCAFVIAISENKQKAIAVKFLSILVFLIPIAFYTILDRFCKICLFIIAQETRVSGIFLASETRRTIVQHSLKFALIGLE
jgi:hypothetical protein